MSEIDLLRIEIDDIDQELTKLLERRLNMAKKIAEHKKKQGLPILDESREEVVIQKNIDRLNNPDYADKVREFYINLMDISKDVQEDLIK
ncbi:MAG: chorismate mutase [Atopococcus tabaci]|uniref:Chorismate mutase n=1 Tax=Atopococcus tabaci TaxID=269774 RepID=A0AA43UCV7_9LACT|nr:chorismate mutase [Atopococcus tabaci]